MTTTGQDGRSKGDEDRCECGCGERADRTVRLLREQDRGTAEALGWTELSIAPMRVAVRIVAGHDADGIDGYVG